MLHKSYNLVYKLVIFVVFVFSFAGAYAQDTTNQVVKKGWSLAGLPNIAFNSDIGFKAGAVAKIFNYGDGSYYPDYKHLFYIDLYTSTKKVTNLTLLYDSKYLFKNLRITASAKSYTEIMKDFYGFNGYEAFYDTEITNTASANYICRAYYKYQQKYKMFNIKIRGNLSVPRFYWALGTDISFIDIQSVDRDKVNKGKPEKDWLPAVKDAPGLYEKYTEWNFIKPDEKKGGNVIELKTGIQYDSRSSEANPDKGCYSEMTIIAAQALKSSDNRWLLLSATHRQFITIVPHRLTFAGRLTFNARLAGTIPFYQLPALGGGGSIRGVLYNRIAGNSIANINLELRYKILKTIILNNNFYIALSAFHDAGMVIAPYRVVADTQPEIEYLEKGTSEKLHHSVGAGIYFAINENFIVACNYGRALNPQDGKSGLYIGLDFLF